MGEGCALRDIDLFSGDRLRLGDFLSLLALKRKVRLDEAILDFDALDVSPHMETLNLVCASCLREHGFALLCLYRNRGMLHRGVDIVGVQLDRIDRVLQLVARFYLAGEALPQVDEVDGLVLELVAPRVLD